MDRTDSHCSDRTERHDDCHVEPIEPSPHDHDDGLREVAYLTIHGMGCPTCVTRVRNALLATPGVITADVRLEAQHGSVIYDPAHTNAERLEDAVVEMGRASRHDYHACTTAVRVVDRRSDHHLR